jgi:MFS family permease
MSSTLNTKTIVATVIGNALEWYDFVIYSFMTVVIAKLYFPTTHAVNSILAASATFAVAFCFRPLGGIVLGIYADKKGRKKALTLVISIMTIAIMMITLAPTYAQIGVTAPILLIIARILQGFSSGGEFGVSTSILIELAPIQKRGFYASWQMVGQMMAMLIAAIMCLAVTYLLTIEQLESFGWRIPFFIGLIIAPVGMYLRRSLAGTNHIVQENRKDNRKKVIWKKLISHRRELCIAMGLIVGATVAIYINISYLPTYVASYLQLPISEAFIAVGLSVFVMLPFIVFFGWLSDKIGRSGILLTALILYTLAIYPLFSWLISTPSLYRLIITEMACCMLLAAYLGVLVVILAELFSIDIRSSGLGISYNFSVMLFGGFAQVIVTWLIHVVNKPIAISYYLLFALGISLISALAYVQEARKQSYFALPVN